MTVPDLVLNSGRTIPQLGFGVAQIGAAGTADAVAEALRVGYRHIDTAQRYGNEKEVAEAIRDSGLNRDEVYLTSKRGLVAARCGSDSCGSESWSDR